MFKTQIYFVYNDLDRKAKNGEAGTSDCFWLEKSSCHFQMNKSNLQILGYTVSIKLQIIFSYFSTVFQCRLCRDWSLYFIRYMGAMTAPICGPPVLFSHPLFSRSDLQEPTHS